jgi:hypothetical protein
LVSFGCNWLFKNQVKIADLAEILSQNALNEPSPKRVTYLERAIVDLVRLSGLMVLMYIDIDIQKTKNNLARTIIELIDRQHDTLSALALRILLQLGDNTLGKTIPPLYVSLLTDDRIKPSLRIDLKK